MSNRSKMHDPWGHSAAYVQGAKERTRLPLRSTGESIMSSSPTNAGSPNRLYMSPAKRAERQAERQQIVEQRAGAPMLGQRSISTPFNNQNRSVGAAEMMQALALTRHRSDGDISVQRRSSLVFNGDTGSGHSSDSTLDWGRRRVSLKEKLKEQVNRLPLSARACARCVLRF